MQTIGHAIALLDGPIFMRGPRRATDNFYEAGGLAGVSLLREIGLTIREPPCRRILGRSVGRPDNMNPHNTTRAGRKEGV